MKMFTMFSSYFFRTWNLTAESAGKTNFKSPAEMGKFIVDLTMLYVVPAAISAAVFDVAIQSAIGGDPDEDKFWKGFYSKLIGGVIVPFPGLNQMSSLVSGFNGYEGPAGARIFAEVGKFAKQAGQGEADVAFWKSANNLGGIVGQYPSGQINKTVQGMIELSEGRGNVLSLMFGKPKK
ncbi:MAG: hypothetical protein HXX17_11840 [Geobacteraceae bacterium]|nr:hypothetical protein [Geobacteraceae bacterium]